jgi:metal-responsive CopG/Arc/MetJ family transcriptional regulator
MQKERIIGVPVGLTSKTIDVIEEIAHENKVSRSEIVRIAVEEYLRRNKMTNKRA